MVRVMITMLPCCRALSWAAARQHCVGQGTELAEMNTMQEQRAVTSFLNSWSEWQTLQSLVTSSVFADYGIPFWLGGRRNGRGKWRWAWTESRVASRAVKWGWAQGEY